MNSYKLTQTAAELQADLDKVESLATIKSVGTGLNLNSSTGELTGTGVASIGGKTGAITLGSGLNIDNSNQMSNTGVISIGSKTGTITLGTGLSINSSNVLSCTINGISYSIVNQLPSTGVNGTIYLVPLTSSTTNNAYREFIYVNNAWEQIGTTEVDLSDYYTKTQTDTLLGGKQNSLNTPAGSGLTLAPSTIPNMVDIKMTAFTSTDVTLNETGYATVTYNITNGSAIGPSTVYARPTGGPSITIGIASSIGYALPMSVTVTNATYTYDNTTGIITAQPTGDMVVTATCVVPVTVTYNITNGTSDGPATIRTGDTLSFNITPSSGYGYPTTLTVTGIGPLDYTYNSSTGAFTAFPVGNNNITITGECVASAPSGYEVILYGRDGTATEYVYVQINDDPTWYWAYLENHAGFSSGYSNIPNVYNIAGNPAIGIPNVSKIRIGLKEQYTPYYDSDYSTGDFTNLTFTSTGGSAPAYATSEITMTQDSSIDFTGND